MFNEGDEMLISFTCFVVGFFVGSTIETYRQHRHFNETKEQTLAKLDQLSEKIKSQIDKRNQ